MKKLFFPNIYLALIHHPVINKNGETIASAVTNLDLHDISRAGKTYGVKAFYVATPLKDQKELVERIVEHWTKGTGATYNPVRKEALKLISVKESFNNVLSEIEKIEGISPKIVVTSAKKRLNSIDFSGFRKKLKEGAPHLLLFGTAWGLAREIIAQADYTLSPIMGNADYNHLSVRSAVAIILDRIIGYEDH